MKTTIFLFHPNLAESKINARMIKDINIEVRNIYALYPDGNIDVQKEQEALTKADRIIFQFPMYWYSTPSLMRKWENLVLEHGWAYGSQGHALDNKEVLIAVSTGARLSDYQPGSEQNHTVNEYLLPLFATFATTRMTILQPFIIDGGLYINESELKKRALEYQKLLTQEKLPQLTSRIL